MVDDDNNPMPTGEPGEVVIRGYNVMQGFVDDPEATAEAIDAAGWLHTGDIGVLDERGNLRITDRKKDMFIIGGFNAYPAEIENMISDHPAVSQVSIVGVPDERMGEVGYAFVVLRPGQSLDADTLIPWCRERMANYKVPRYVKRRRGAPPQRQRQSPEVRATRARHDRVGRRASSVGHCAFRDLRYGPTTRIRRRRRERQRVACRWYSRRRVRPWPLAGAWSPCRTSGSRSMPLGQATVPAVASTSARAESIGFGQRATVPPAIECARSRPRERGRRRTSVSGGNRPDARRPTTRRSLTRSKPTEGAQCVRRASGRSARSQLSRDSGSSEHRPTPARGDAERPAGSEPARIEPSSMRISASSPAYNAWK